MLTTQRGTGGGLKSEVNPLLSQCCITWRRLNTNSARTLFCSHQRRMNIPFLCVEESRYLLYLHAVLIHIY